jgi:hypothetical protein
MHAIENAGTPKHIPSKQSITPSIFIVEIFLYGFIEQRHIAVPSVRGLIVRYLALSVERAKLAACCPKRRVHIGPEPSLAFLRSSPSRADTLHTVTHNKLTVESETSLTACSQCFQGRIQSPAKLLLHLSFPLLLITTRPHIPKHFPFRVGRVFNS